MTELFSPKVDYIFKKIFGSEAHPKVLISFLNACFKGSVIVTSVQIKNGEMAKEFVENSFARLDILATTNLDEMINIEMQRRDENNMVKRSLFYWSKAYSNSYNGKSEYQSLPRTICINVLDFELLDEKSHHNIYHLYNEKNKKLLTDTLELHFIELPKLSSEGNEDNEDKLNQWLNFIIDPDSEQSLAAELKNPFIHEARTELTRISRDPKEAEIYRQRENALSDKSNALLSAEKKGREESKIETARLAKKEGASIELIMKITGLRKEEIEAL